jgi:hypothetical protein
MTAGHQLAVDFVLGGLALLIIRSLDRWFYRAKPKSKEIPADQKR